MPSTTTANRHTTTARRDGTAHRSRGCYKPPRDGADPGNDKGGGIVELTLPRAAKLQAANRTGSDSVVNDRP
jgi:hypothetical protein